MKVSQLREDNQSLLFQVSELQDTAQEQRYRYSELQELVSSYIRDIDALHKYSNDRFADVRSANERVDEVLSMLKMKTEENEALLSQIQFYRSSSLAGGFIGSNTYSSGVNSSAVADLQQQQLDLRMQLQLQQRQLEMRQLQQQQQQQAQIHFQRQEVESFPAFSGSSVLGQGAGYAPSTVTGSETVRIFRKIDPDDEALEHGILLSKQLEKYGLTMYDAIRPTDEAAITAYMGEGYTRSEAVLLIFEARYGPVGTTSGLGLLSIPTVDFRAN